MWWCTWAQPAGQLQSSEVSKFGISSCQHFSSVNLFYLSFCMYILCKCCWIYDFRCVILMLRFSTEDQYLTFQQVTEAVQYWCRFSPSSVSDMTLWKNSCWNWAYFGWIAITQTLGFRSLHCPPRGLWIQLHWALHSPFQWMKWCRFTGECYGVSSPMVRCSADTSLPLSIVVSDAQCFCFCKNGCTYFQRRYSFQKPIQGYFCICASDESCGCWISKCNNSVLNDAN